MTELNYIKEKYDNVLKRYKRAEKYMDNLNTPLSQKEKYVGHFYEIIVQLNNLLDEIKDYTKHEAMNGFFIDND